MMKTVLTLCLSVKKYLESIILLAAIVLSSQASAFTVTQTVSNHFAPIATINQYLDGQFQLGDSVTVDISYNGAPPRASIPNPVDPAATNHVFWPTDLSIRFSVNGQAATAANTYDFDRSIAILNNDGVLAPSSPPSDVFIYTKLFATNQSGDLLLSLRLGDPTGQKLTNQNFYFENDPASWPLFSIRGAINTGSGIVPLFATQPTAVPVPAAVLLFASGLISLISTRLLRENKLS